MRYGTTLNINRKFIIFTLSVVKIPHLISKFQHVLCKLKMVVIIYAQINNFEYYIWFFV